MKLVFCSNSGESLPIAYRLRREGTDASVYLHCPAYRNNYDGLVPKLNLVQLKAAVKKADLVIFDITRPNEKTKQDVALLKTFGLKTSSKSVFGPVADKLRKSVKVIGCSTVCEDIELGRAKGVELAERMGFSIPETNRFKTLSEGIRFLKSSNDLWVFKPEDNQDLDLTYVEKFPGELITKLEAEYKERLGEKIDFILQKKIDGVELSSEVWLGPKGPVHLNHTLENKRLMDGNLGPAIGSQSNTVWIDQDLDGICGPQLVKMAEYLRKDGYIGPCDANCIIGEKDQKPYFLEWSCYDDQTEVLTKSGWKLFRDVDLENDLICTLNPQTDHVEYHKATGYIEKDYSGDMIQIKNEGGKHHNLDVLVTPDHDMYFRQNGKTEFEIIKAQDLPKHGGVLKRIAKWQGKNEPRFSLPAHIEQHVNNRHSITYPIEHPAIEIDMKAWLRFLGLYLAEGCLGKGCYRVDIAQADKNRHRTDAIMNALPFKYYYSGHKYSICSVQLGTYIKNLGLGLCHEKFIPDQFKELAPEYLQALFEGLVAGDGGKHKRTGQVSFRTSSKRLADDVQEIIMKLGMVSNIKTVHQKGTPVQFTDKVYTRNHDMYSLSVRKQDAGIRSAGTFLPQRVPYKGKVYCLDVPNHIIYVRRNGRPLFCGNCRFGYDAIYCLLTLLKGRLTDFFAKDFDVDFHSGFASSERISIPPFPYADSTLLKEYAKDVSILNRMESLQSFWGQDIYLKGGKLACAGSDGILGVVAARGNSLGGAWGSVYRAIEQLKVCSYLQHRLDGHKSLSKRYETLQKWGLVNG